MSKEEVAYFAGLFDGEGCVVINVINRIGYSGDNPNYVLRVTITNNNPTPLFILKEEIGGHLSWNRNDRLRATCTWTTSSLKAEKFLKLIFSYLIIKEDEVKTALAFREFQLNRHKGHNQSCSYPPEIIGAFEGYRAELQYLKKIDYYKNQSLMKN